MQRRLVVLGDRVEFEVEHLERQLAAGDHHRAPTGDPARIECLAPDAAHLPAVARGPRGDPVQRGIEDLDDLAADLDAVWVVDNVLVDRRDLLGDRGLAVSGRSVEQDAAPRIDGRPEPPHEFRRHDEVREGAVDRGLLDPLVVDRLPQDALFPGFERDRSGADILALLLRVCGAAAAGLRHLEALLLIAVRLDHAEALDQLAIGGRLHQLVGHHRREFHLFSELGGTLQAPRLHQLHHQPEQAVQGDAGLAHAVGRLGSRGEDAGQLFGRNDPQRHQVVAEPASAIALPLQAALDIARLDQPVRDQNVAEMHERPPPEAERNGFQRRGRRQTRPAPIPFYGAQRCGRSAYGLFNRND